MPSLTAVPSRLGGPLRGPPPATRSRRRRWFGTFFRFSRAGQPPRSGMGGPGPARYSAWDGRAAAAAARTRACWLAASLLCRLLQIPSGAGRLAAPATQTPESPAGRNLLGAAPQAPCGVRGERAEPPGRKNAHPRRGCSRRGPNFPTARRPPECPVQEPASLPARSTWPSVGRDARACRVQSKPKEHAARPRRTSARSKRLVATDSARPRRNTDRKPTSFPSGDHLGKITHLCVVPGLPPPIFPLTPSSCRAIIPRPAGAWPTGPGGGATATHYSRPRATPKDGRTAASPAG